MQINGCDNPADVFFLLSNSAFVMTTPYLLGLGSCLLDSATHVDAPGKSRSMNRINALEHHTSIPVNQTFFCMLLFGAVLCTDSSNSTS
mmetsp:Transcript_25136/g.35083  ORF Transcript_25136/g.35083 Transcript_25136/m.35083 type:complete len:89 (-) Transcript_25136:277-543(-)